MPRLLLVEDDVDSREMLQFALTHSGFDVVTAANSAEGRRELERGAFDLVLADLVLESPNIDVSWRFVRELAELARPAQVGLLTGWKISQAQTEGLDLAFVMEKPCSRGQLISQLASTLHLPELTEPQRDAIRAYFAALENQDLAALAMLCTEDVVYSLPGTHVRFSNEIRGREAFLAFTEETFRAFCAPQFELGVIRALPSGAMAEYIGSWNNAGGAIRHSLPGAVMFEFRDDLICRISVRVDPDQLT